MLFSDIFAEMRMMSDIVRYFMDNLRHFFAFMCGVDRTQR